MMQAMSDIIRVARVGVEIPSDSDHVFLLLVAHHSDGAVVRVDLTKDEAIKFYQKGELNLLDPLWQNIGHGLRHGTLNVWFKRTDYETLVALVRSAATDERWPQVTN
jgi:hypothetical protein